ncbi:hypothetical protein MN116_005063 [Schistosoma mekongi]|uniref:Uncharacterized protein n=1 Tax=Schistosoma mekongi TaxID=38744 RepID=A0AAE2D524_SCHME|nr:hypothetical protein MN116_005063 [Schistosoma mekongi]
MQSGHPKYGDSIDLEYFLPENESKKNVEKCPPDIYASRQSISYNAKVCTFLVLATKGYSGVCGKEAQ